MPKPKFEKDKVFPSNVQLPAATGAPAAPDTSVPYIPTSMVNQTYEVGAKAAMAGFTTHDFVSPEEKRIIELESQLAQMAQQSGDIVTQDGSLMVHGFQFSPTGLIAPEDFSEESWEQIGQLLFRLEGSIQWLIGDWLAYGANLEYGDIRKLAEALNRDENTLSNYKMVCQNVEFPRRRGNLSFGHHEAIHTLSPDNQVVALAYAEENKLSVAKFRKWLRGEPEQPALPTEPRYHPTKLMESAFAVSEKDLNTIPIRELKSAVDAFDTVIRIATERRNQVFAAVEQRSQK